MIGSSFLGIWQAVMFGIVSSLNSEILGRTIEFTIISKTPLLVVLLSKSLAQMIFGIPAGIIAFVVMVAITQQVPYIANVLIFCISILLSVIGLAVVCLLLSPAMVLTGKRFALLIPVLPIVMILSGFIFPVQSLPLGLEIIARLLPSSWALSSVFQSLDNPRFSLEIILDWSLFLLTSVAWLIITHQLLKIVEKRLRAVGII
jgi:ABC-2 type transport system permease protein